MSIDCCLRQRSRYRTIDATLMSAFELVYVDYISADMFLSAPILFTVHGNNMFTSALELKCSRVR